MHTGERIAWFPTRPASMFIGRLPPRDKALDDLMYAKPEAVEAATGRALEAPPEPAPVLTGPEAIAAAKEVDAKRARRLQGEIARRRAEKLWHRRQWRAFKRRAKQEGDREARMAGAAAAAREVPDMTAEEARTRYLRALRISEEARRRTL